MSDKDKKKLPGIEAIPEEPGLEEADWLPGGLEDFIIPQGLLKKILRKSIGKMMMKEGGKRVGKTQQRSLDKMMGRSKKEEPTLDYGKMERERKAGLDKPERILDYQYDKFGRPIIKERKPD